MEKEFTIEEIETIISTYMTKEGTLKELPSKAKRRIVVLRKIVENFDKDKHYSEIQINQILKKIYPDFPYIRRLLIEHRLLERTRDGSIYWVKQGE